MIAHAEGSGMLIDLQEPLMALHDHVGVPELGRLMLWSVVRTGWSCLGHLGARMWPSELSL